MDLSDYKDSPLWLLFWAIVMFAVYVAVHFATRRLYEAAGPRPDPCKVQRICEEVIQMGDLDIMYVMSIALAQLQARRQLSRPSMVFKEIGDPEKGTQHGNEQEEEELEKVVIHGTREQELLLPESGGWNQ